MAHKLLKVLRKIVAGESEKFLGMLPIVKFQKLLVDFKVNINQLEEIQMNFS